MSLRFASAVVAALSLAGTGVSAAAGTVTLFTDRASFEAAAAALVVEDFNGAASDFAANSTGNVIGSQTTLDLIGGAGDAGPTGLTGTGFLQSEVDSSSITNGDGLEIQFNTGSVFGFGLDGLQDDSATSPGGLDLEEIGIQFDGQSFLVSDILGLTNSSNGNSVSTVENTDPVFVGLLSTEAQAGFRLVHGDDVAPGGVSGGNEEFFINELVLAVNNANVVPVPAALPMMAAGIGLFGFMGWRRRKTA